MDHIGGRYDDLSWHSQCFTCECCNVNLFSEEFDVITDQPYCVNCTSRPEVLTSQKRAICK